MPSTLVASSLIVFFLMTWWRLTWRSNPRGTLMAVVLFSLGATVLILVTEIVRLTAAIS
jgi:hypothetical protein